MNALKISHIIIWLITFAVLFFISRVNYLLFHSLSEVFSICIASAIFILSWNARRYLHDNYLVLLGIAYLFIGILDLFHTLAYKGMSVFTDYDYYANQIWIATRFMESLSLLAAMILLRFKRNIRASLIFLFYTVISVLVLYSVFVWKIFPVCFTEPGGLTPFKKISEYIISLILLSGLYLLYAQRKYFERRIYLYLCVSIICTILSELSFTFYISNYGISNLTGHFFKIFSFYCMYKALIEEGIEKPYNLIFKDLKEKEQTILIQNKQLQRLANTDSLTSLHNNMYIRHLLQNEMERSQRYSNNLSIIMFDLDNFKKINDTQGHLRGDEVLAGIAGIMTSALRQTDYAGRYGGEEFLVILPETNELTGMVVAEKIRSLIDSHYSINPDSFVSVSGGLAEYTAGMSISEFIGLADKRLYISKNEGKNRVTGSA